MSTKKSKHPERKNPADEIEAMFRSIVPVEQVMSELGFKDPRRVQQLCKQGRLGRMMMHRCIITRQELDEFKKIERPTGVRKEFHRKRA